MAARLTHLPRRVFKSLASRIGFFVFVATLASALAVAGTSALAVRQFLRAQTEDRIPEAAGRARERLHLWYAQRLLDIDVFAHSDLVVGGLPCLIPAMGERADVEGFLARLDGLILTGSPSNVLPALYGGPPHPDGVPEDPAREVREMVERLRAADGPERLAPLRKTLQEEMDKNAQVFRTEESLASVTKTIQELRDRYQNIGIQDRGKRFNTDLLEAIELGFLLDIAEVVVFSARNRKESRGGHMRDDYPDRNDADYMQHTMAYLVGDLHSANPEDHIRMDWKPVTITHYQPMERKY